MPKGEVTFIEKVLEGKTDHPKWIAAICPNCLRRAHYGYDAIDYNDKI